MVTTICWSTSDRLDYALEAIIVACGATIQWLRDQLGHLPVFACKAESFFATNSSLADQGTAGTMFSYVLSASLNAEVFSKLSLKHFSTTLWHPNYKILASPP